MSDDVTVVNSPLGTYNVRTKEVTGAKHEQIMRLSEIDSITQTTFDVASATSTLVLAANADRKYAFIQNLSDTIMYISFTNPAAANTGIILNPRGAAYEMNWNNMITEPIYAFHSGTGTKKLTAIEG
jgi:hypothetical protein